MEIGFRNSLKRYGMIRVGIPGHDKACSVPSVKFKGWEFRQIFKHIIKLRLGINGQHPKLKIKVLCLEEVFQNKANLPRIGEIDLKMQKKFGKFLLKLLGTFWASSQKLKA